MTQQNINDIINRWKITDAFVKGLANNNDSNVWLSQCSKSSFRTSFSFYTSIEKTYIGMLDNVNYFTNNCSVEGLLSYIHFYENQTKTKWKEVYFSDINTHKHQKDIKHTNTNWWESHIAEFI
jgi:hypothetical protein